MKNNIPIVWPPGGHGIFIKANELFPPEKRPWSDFAHMGLVIELCRQYGIRALEIGYMSNGIDIQAEKNGGELPSVLPHNFIRMIIPANVYQQTHMDYVVDSITKLT